MPSIWLNLARRNTITCLFYISKALELCSWSLEQDSRYVLKQDSDLSVLVEQAVSREQYQTVIQLIENYVGENPTADNAAHLLFTATNINQQKLNNQT